MTDESPPRRQMILRTAERLFVHYGPQKTTIADIARACGIAVGTVYLDFRSKESIVRELVAHKSRRVAEEMHHAARAAGPDATAQLTAALRARVGALFDLAGSGQHACDLVRCESRRVGFGDEPRAVLQAIVERGVASGELIADEPEATLETIETAFRGLSPPDLYALERSRAEAVAGRLAALIARGLATTK